MARAPDRTLVMAPLFAAVALSMTLAAPSPAAAQGISYSVSPSIGWVQWDDQLGLDDARFLGGSATIGFGDFVGLEGFYFTNDEIESELAETDLFGEELPGFEEQRVDVASYGGNIVFNLASGALVPVIQAGGGILRFDPENGDSFKQLQLRFGGGLKATLGDAIRAEAMVENTRFRMNRNRLVALQDGEEPGSLPDDPRGDEAFSNLAFRLGLGIRLGGGAPDSDLYQSPFDRPFSDLAFVIAPFGGLLQFDNAAGVDDQELAGVNAGVDFGSYFGVRGFYWKGVSSKFDDFEPIQGYGGEARFNLGDGPGVTPHLVAGAGRLDFDPDFESTESGEAPADQTALILGGGVDFNLGTWARLTATARDYLVNGDDFQAESDLPDASDPGDLLHNWQFTAGIKFLVGGGGGFRRAVVTRDQAERERREAVEQALAEAARSGSLRDSVVILIDTLGVDREGRAVVRTDSVQVRAAGAERVAADMPGATRTGAPSGGAAGEVVQIPVPSRGEVYIRYGEGAEMRVGPGETVRPASREDRESGLESMTTSELRQLIREEVGQAPRTDVAAGDSADVPPTGPRPEDRMSAAEMRLMIRDELERLARAEDSGQARDSAVSSARIEEIMERLERRVEELEEQERRLQELEEDLRRREDALREEDPARVVVVDPAAGAERPGVRPGPGPEAPDTVPVRGTYQAIEDRTLEIRPYAGASFDQVQLIGGVMADLGPITPGSPLHWMPEVALGAGEGPTSFMVAGNVEYDLPWVFRGDSFGFQPVVMGGLGLFSAGDTEAVLNLLYGGELSLNLGGGDWNLFAGHQGVDLFNRNRLLAGFRYLR